MVSWQADVTKYLYCASCGKAWAEESTNHPDHMGTSIDFPGIFLQRDFVTESEEKAIVEKIYQTPFVESQSGRRKQVQYF